MTADIGNMRLCHDEPIDWHRPTRKSFVGEKQAASLFMIHQVLATLSRRPVAIKRVATCYHIELPSSSDG